MRTYDYPDGSKLEITSTSNVNGPDQVGGLHYGTNFNYARVAGGEWRPTTARSLHSALTLAGAAESASEAFEAITGE